MNTQIRILTILLGALLVVMTYTFPLWQPYLDVLPGGRQSVFPGLPAELAESYLLLPEEQRAALEDLVEEEPELALQLVIAQLGGTDPVLEANQEMPEDLLGRVTIALGDFVPSTPAVRAEGQLTIFELADGRKVIRMNDLAVTNVPDMSVWLSASSAPVTPEEMRLNDIHQEIGTLQGNIGSQNYIVAAEVDLTQYNSIVIYSESLDFVVSYAQFTIRF